MTEDVLDGSRTTPATTVTIAATVNGEPWSGVVAVDELLLDLLRLRLGLTGAKRGCNTQVCGACTVLVDGGPVSACTYLAFEVDGREVRTVEGLAGEEVTPLQDAFVRNVAQQCGYCTSGQLMACTALLERRDDPDETEIREWMRGNVCRCGCYPAILSSVQEVARMRSTASDADEDGTGPW